MSVELLIKSPNQQIEDVKIKCDISWNIKELKDYLSSHHPLKPLACQQRIIYSGRLLSDHHILKDILTQDLELHIIHLVCPQSTHCIPQDEQPKSTDAETVPSVGNVEPSTISEDGLRDRFWTSQNNQMNYYTMYSQGLVPQTSTVTTPPSDIAYQWAAMQQTYAQVMAQFLASQAGYLNATVNPISGVAMAPAANEVSRTTEPVNVQAAHTNDRRVQENNNGVRHERDFLEFLYIVSKSLVLCMILYFYSTPGKVILVMCLAFLLFVYRTARSSGRSQESDSTRPNNGNGADANPLPAEQNGERNAEQQQQDNRLVLRDLLISITNFIATFFTSLVPDQPLPIET